MKDGLVDVYRSVVAQMERLCDETLNDTELAAAMDNADSVFKMAMAAVKLREQAVKETVLLRTMEPGERLHPLLATDIREDVFAPDWKKPKVIAGGKSGD